MGHQLSPQQEEQLRHYGELLIEDGDRLGLTALRDVDVIRQQLIEDSLAGCQDLQGPQVLDLGSGGGCPGIPIAIARPDLQVVLLEANGRKMGFLKYAVPKLGLQNVDFLHGRSEEFAHQPQWRGKFDAVVCKAVAALPALIELTIPFLRVGGCLWAYKGPQLSTEIDQSRKALAELHAQVDQVTPYQNGERSLFLCRIHKLEPTPSNYPRRAGIPAKQPLL